MVKFVVEDGSFMSIAFAFEQEVVDSLGCVCIAVGTVGGVQMFNVM